MLVRGQVSGERQLSSSVNFLEVRGSYRQAQNSRRKVLSRRLSHAFPEVRSAHHQGEQPSCSSRCNSGCRGDWEGGVSWAPRAPQQGCVVRLGADVTKRLHGQHFSALGETCRSVKSIYALGAQVQRSRKEPGCRVAAAKCGCGVPLFA